MFDVQDFVENSTEIAAIWQRYERGEITWEEHEALEQQVIAAERART